MDSEIKWQHFVIRDIQVVRKFIFYQVPLDSDNDRLMMRMQFCCLAMVFLFLRCKSEPVILMITANEHYRLKGYQKLKTAHRLQLTTAEEPGQLLAICVKVIDKEHKKALSNSQVHVYYANAAGEYEPSRAGDVSSARLSGQLRTNDLGMFYVETILPGSDTGKNRQPVHIRVPTTNSEAFDIHFEQFTGYFNKRSTLKSDQHVLTTLKKDQTGRYIGFVTLEVKQ